MSESPRRHRPNAQARREALLAAAAEVAAEQGVAGITHRAVTAKAGLPLATASYFFSSIDELAHEALRTFMAADAEVQIALAAQLRGEEHSPDEIAHAFAAVAMARHPDTLALFEAFLASARDPRHREAVGDALAAADAVAAAALAAAGADHPETLAPAFAALAHGLALHEIAVPGRVTPDGRYRAFRALFLGYLVDAGRADLAARLAKPESS